MEDEEYTEYELDFMDECVRDRIGEPKCSKCRNNETYNMVEDEYGDFVYVCWECVGE